MTSVRKDPINISGANNSSFHSNFGPRENLETLVETSRGHLEKTPPKRGGREHYVVPDLHHVLRENEDNREGLVK